MVEHMWNELPVEATEADPNTIFRRHLDRYYDRMDLEGYGLMWANRTNPEIQLSQYGQGALNSIAIKLYNSMTNGDD